MSKKIVIEKNDRKVTTRNYFIVLIVSIILIALTLYVRSFIISYRVNVSSVSIFKDNVQSINLNDLDYMIPETGEAILFISYTGNIKVNSMENTLYKKIQNENIKEKVIYLDITEYMEDLGYINILKEKFPDVSDEINTAPIFIYIKDGKAIEAMSSELKLIDYKVFNKLLEKYEIE